MMAFCRTHSAFVGTRLVYSQGIYVLAVLAGILLILFRGVTDNLIPLYAIGAFLAFTLSQAGMVGHWRRNRGPGAVRSMIVNGLGAVATGVTLVVVVLAKFTSGAWVSVLLIAGIMSTMPVGAPPLFQCGERNPAFHAAAN